MLLCMYFSVPRLWSTLGVCTRQWLFSAVEHRLPGSRVFPRFEWGALWPALTIEAAARMRHSPYWDGIGRHNCLGTTRKYHNHLSTVYRQRGWHLVLLQLFCHRHGHLQAEQQKDRSLRITLTPQYWLSNVVVFSRREAFLRNKTPYHAGQCIAISPYYLGFLMSQRDASQRISSHPFHS